MVEIQQAGSAISSDPRLAAIWLGALIDGEGCVWVGKLKTGPAAGETRRTISIGMTDQEVIRFASECLTTLGARHSVYSKAATVNRRAVYTISISGQIAIRRLAAVLFLSHNGKRARLASILAGYKPLSCGACGADYNKRTRGCESCQARMKYRRKHGLPNTVGRTGRLPKSTEVRL